ncbi:D-2-hydroxyglutarate dehydrogenase YdiJ [Halotalea alkalilenta]|uniref:D-2-hydroxyglutarate dehydrogenase YdiJ n=1 Tax=Halotalea alkalilenta TaxID=376489 RepID=UPI0004824899|nr:FAD-binding and (Fe-S)-binding domain-containing protein [Halotalea alkalilenta]
MITQLDDSATETLAPRYRRFLDRLAELGFKGQIDTDDAHRTVLSTDNSIYQRQPQAAIFPRDADDLTLVARLAGQAEFAEVVLTARGGGTGTNGQSLTDGVVVDLSRHLNRIIEIDVERRRVRVQAGVVKDQLNAALKPHGLFFAPELSTSNRATIGGMINTDASGQGSCEYGKTRDHVLALDTVLIGGERFEARPLDADQAQAMIDAGGKVGELHRVAREVIDQHREAIEARFPSLNRCLTGYDLAHLRDADGRLDLKSLLCGGEGSLGFIVEATLNVLPIPKHSALVNVRYASFMDALRDASALMHGAATLSPPTSIETIDDKVLGLAMADIVWERVAEYFPPGSAVPTEGINLVEFNDEDADALARRVKAFLLHLDTDPSVTRLGHTVAWGRAEMASVYAMRKRSVGLLGNVEGEKRPIPFVEDTAVPPERLADYIAEFRALLDARGLDYGMFGHVDAGVLHVRPAIDMKDPAQARLIREISDEVAELTLRYGGLLWGEHGKGVRSEYSPGFFGPLYPLLQRIKTACDPHNQLNPGKIATPSGSAEASASWRLLKIDEVPTRGERDRQIPVQSWRYFGAAMHCNGNGACYNYDPDDAMCPSWKGTRDRVHSPKGRATLFKEWLLRQHQAGVDIERERKRLAGAGPLDHLRALPARALRSLKRERDDFSDQVYGAMAGCLACKSCAGQCPVKVNVPDFRAEFLALYHGRYLRGPRDHLIGALEAMIPRLAPFAAAYNALGGWRPVSRLVERWIGLVDMPRLTRAPLHKQLAAWNVPIATPQRLDALPPERRDQAVVLVQDAFTSYFDTAVVRDVIELLRRLGVEVLVAPYAANGKPLQVQGFLGRFERTARRQAERLSALASRGVPLVGIDPAMTLCYRQEYAKALGPGQAPKVALLQEWLLDHLDRFARPLTHPANQASAYRLLAHCTEKTTAPGSVSGWQRLFTAFGLELGTLETGCCGMSGTYGHEARNLETSKRIYALSWQPKIEQAGETVMLATGYSCRSQVKRFSATRLDHPFQALLRAHKRAIDG